MINIMSPINFLGYGNVGFNIVKNLYKKDGRVTLYPIGEPTRVSYEIKSAMSNVKFLNKNFPCLRIWHQHDMSNWLSFPTIGFPIFELDKFNEQELHHLKIPDKLFVCSNWAKDVILNNIPAAKVEVVNLGFDKDIFFPEEKSSERNTIFLNCGKWEIRKGHDVLVEIFNKAFTIEDNVELWLMPTNPFLTKEEEKYWKSLYLNSPMGRKIKILPHFETHEQVASIMRMADYGIFPSRAEGWNLEAVEMIACGKEVIITDYSAHKEYINSENSTAIQIHGLEPAYDGKWFFKQGSWSHFSPSVIDDFISAVRKKYKENKKKESNISKTVEHLTWENTTNKISEIINEMV